MTRVMIPDISTSKYKSAQRKNITNSYECKYSLKRRQMIFVVI